VVSQGERKKEKRKRGGMKRGTGRTSVPKGEHPKTRKGAGEKRSLNFSKGQRDEQLGGPLDENFYDLK